MSMHETRAGTLKRTNLNMKEAINIWLETNEKPYYYSLPEDTDEMFRDVLSGTYVLLDDTIFEIVSDKNLANEDIYELTKKTEETYSYILKYYNGGCSFEEALRKAYTKLEEGEKND